MDFACIVLFLAMYYLKPQEWSSAFETIKFVKITMFFSILTLFFRERSLKLRDFFRTPHDWAMALFCGWIVLTYPDGPRAGLGEMLNRIVFYIVIIHTITNWDRLTRFLGWWTFFTWMVAFLAIAGEYFWDPLDSFSKTHGVMKDRLILNLSMVNNPNALGHTIVAAIPMIYFFCIWKRNLFMKQIGYLSLILPLMAIYLTFSKGAYLVGAAVIVATFTFGRPKWAQVLIVCVAIGGGLGALYALPRMNELQSTKSDEAVQGRVKAFTFGKIHFERDWRGVGMNKFVDTLISQHNYRKAAHATYVQTGTELGKTGMFFFLLVLWTCFRTTMFAKTKTPEQERIRRLLFVLVASFALSGWMVDFAYRATFFMFAAAAGAFHRMLYLEEKMRREDEEDANENKEPWRTRLEPVTPVPRPVLAGMQPALAGGGVMEVARTVEEPQRDPRRPWLRSVEDEEPQEQPEQQQTFWQRLGLLDFLVCYAWLQLVGYLWEYAIKNI